MTTKSTYLSLVLLGMGGFPLAAVGGVQSPSGEVGVAAGVVAPAPAAKTTAAPSPVNRQPSVTAPKRSATVAQGNPGIAPINSQINSVKSYADLGAEWWQWAVQAPFVDSPLLDPDGTKCRVGQEGPVWFLAGTLGSSVPTTRQCEVPGNKAIFFPVINAAYFAFLNDPPETRTAAAVRSAADAACDTSSISNLSVAIDGRPVAKPAQYYTSVDKSPLFQAQLPTDNIFSADTSWIPDLVLSPAAHKGFYIYVKPLTPGRHTIEWTATWDCGSEDIKYELDVLTGVAGLEE